jgi:hypothetical protein
VVHYKCPPDITFEEFGSVYRVLRRMHVESDSVMAHSAALQYFGPFDSSEMLVDYMQLPVHTRLRSHQAAARRLIWT